MVYHIGMTVKYSFVHEQLLSIIDAINMEPEPTTRLAILYQFFSESQNLIRQSRNDAAYNAREKYALEDIEHATNIDRKRIDYWTKQHCERTGAPRLKRKQRQNLDNYIDLSRDQVAYRRKEKPTIEPFEGNDGGVFPLSDNPSSL